MKKFLLLFVVFASLVGTTYAGFHFHQKNKVHVAVEQALKLRDMQVQVLLLSRQRLLKQGTLPADSKELKDLDSAIANADLHLRMQVYTTIQQAGFDPDKYRIDDNNWTIVSVQPQTAAKK